MKKATTRQPFAKVVFVYVLTIAMIINLQVSAGAAQGAGTSNSQTPIFVTGVHSNNSQGEIVAYRGEVRVPGANWFRIRIADYNLGQRSYIRFVSLKDGGEQRLDAASMAHWYSSTAYFNGDAVSVELHVAPGEQGIFVIGSDVTSDVSEGVGKSVEEIETPHGPDALCGTDTRVADTDPRVGRIISGTNTAWVGWCTAWLTSNGSVLTAGHCLDDDDNGVADLMNGVVEFDVPASNANGTINRAAPNNQYPINANTFVFRNVGVGQDWAVFAVNPNTGGGLLPHYTRGFFRMSNQNPSTNDTMRVTGYGQDDSPPGSSPPGSPNRFNTQSQTEQTATGPYLGNGGSGQARWHEARVVAEPGNSGSPMIWEANGFTVGIVSHEGCDGSNERTSATSFTNPLLAQAVQDFPGGNTVYVDASPPTQSRTGTVFHPFTNVSDAVNAVVSGGRISIVAGSYSGPITINKAVTLVAPVGAVTIGQ